MFEEMENLLRKFSRVNRELARIFEDLEPKGPMMSVRDQGDSVALVVEAPGMNKSQLKQWAIQVTGRTAHLRGHTDFEQTVRSDSGSSLKQASSSQFVKSIALPYEVVPKPSSVELKDGVVTIVLDKQKSVKSDGWRNLGIK